MRVSVTSSSWLHGALFALTFAASGCTLDRSPASTQVADPARGRLLLRQYGCGSCHRIPGVAGPRGDIGPPLAGVGRRAYLGGVLPNNPENLAAWIRSPQSFDPPTAMPDLRVLEPHARDMAAYLSELR